MFTPIAHHIDFIPSIKALQQQLDGIQVVVPGSQVQGRVPSLAEGRVCEREENRRHQRGFDFERFIPVKLNNKCVVRRIWALSSHRVVRHKSSPSRRLPCWASWWPCRIGSSAFSSCEHSHSPQRGKRPCFPTENE